MDGSISSVGFLHGGVERRFTYAHLPGAHYLRELQGAAMMRNILMRQLKIDVLSALVVTDKLELGEPQASGKSAPVGA